MPDFSLIPDLLADLLVPLNLCIALLVLGLALALFKRRKTGCVCVALGLAWVLVWSLPVTSLWLGGALEQRYPYRPPASAPTADAILVLGGHVANGRANWFLPYDHATAIPRTNIALALFQAHRAPKIVLAGGALEGEVSEAQGMAYRLRQKGVPADALILENDSRTTYENAILSEDALDLHDIKTVLLVTSALHMPRAMAAFTKQEVQVIPAPTPPQIFLPADGSVQPWLPNLRALDASRTILKEYAALLLYWWRGWV